MKIILEQFAAYNIWADTLVLARLRQLPQELLTKENGSSFGSIYKTLVHMMEAESIWWQRLKLQEHVQLPEKDMEENLEELAQKFLTLSRQWYEWIKNSNEKNITHVFGYQNTHKEYFKQPVNEMLMHLFNHQTYHRGQIITMLRQAGVSKIPKTDFIVFTRKK